MSNLNELFHRTQPHIELLALKLFPKVTKQVNKKFNQSNILELFTKYLIYFTFDSKVM